MRRADVARVPPLRAPLLRDGPLRVLPLREPPPCDFAFVRLLAVDGDELF